MLGALRTGLIGLGAILLPVALALSHRNGTIILALIGVAGLTLVRHWRMPSWSWPAYGLIAWAALTSLWSPYQNAGDWFPNLVALALIVTAAMAAGAGRDARLMLWSMVFCMLLMGAEAVTGGLLRDLTPPDHRPDKDDVATARGITILLGFAPAALVVLWREGGRRRFLAGALVLPIGVAAFSFGIFANALAFLVAGAAMLFTARFPRTGLRLLFIGAGAGFVLFPLISAALPPVEALQELTAGPVSWRQRLVILKTVWSATMADGPVALLVGHGVEGARVLGYEAGAMSLPGLDASLNLVPSHPHNLFLQIWYDLGLVGVVLGLLALGVGGEKALQALGHRSDLAAAAAGVGAVALVIASVDASLWTQWRLVGPLLGAWLLVRCEKVSPKTSSRIAR